MQHPLITKEYLNAAQNYAPVPIVLDKGKGVWIKDVNGKKYIDMMSAYSAVSFGHSNPVITKALIKQAKRLGVASRAYYNSILPNFLEMLVGMTGMDKAIPMNTGAEAVETAIKAARLWGYKRKGIEENKAIIVTANGNFHGRTTTIISFSTEEAYKDGFGPFTPGFMHVPFNDVEALEKMFKKHGKRICAFLIEPLQGEAGIIVPNRGYLARVQELCKAHNILLIVDEVQSGMGRTGKDFAFQYEIDRPDGLILGKALGGGVLPVSAFLGTYDVMDCFVPGSHGSTFGGNALAAAVGLKALELLKTKHLSKRSAELGKYLKEEMEKINHPSIRNVRGQGLWVGVDIDPDYISGAQVCQLMANAGLLTKDTHGTVIRLAPPLTITKRELDYAIKIIKKVFASI